MRWLYSKCHSMGGVGSFVGRWLTSMLGTRSCRCRESITITTQKAQPEWFHLDRILIVRGHSWWTGSLPARRFLQPAQAGFLLDTVGQAAHVCLLKTSPSGSKTVPVVQQNQVRYLWTFNSYFFSPVAFSNKNNQNKWKSLGSVGNTEMTVRLGHPRQWQQIPGTMAVQPPCLLPWHLISSEFRCPLTYFCSRLRRNHIQRYLPGLWQRHLSLTPPFFADVTCGQHVANRDWRTVTILGQLAVMQEGLVAGISSSGRLQMVLKAGERRT